MMVEARSNSRRQTVIFLHSILTGEMVICTVRKKKLKKANLNSTGSTRRKAATTTARKMTETSNKR